MFRTLFLLFIILPIIEIMVLMEVGALLGLWPTLAVVVLTAWAGAKLVREQGISTLNTIQGKLAQGQLPSDDIIAGLMILVSGVLMLTPGFITDFFGLFLLWPQGRQLLARLLKDKVLVGQLNKGQGHFYSSSFEQQGFSSNVYEHQHDQQAAEGELNKEQPKNILEGEFQRKD
jgi:UPF0716 protein FxsA